MEKEFDQYEFENYLGYKIIDGKCESEISDLIENQLTSDNDFREQYALWLEKSGYKSWKEFLYDEFPFQDEAADI